MKVFVPLAVFLFCGLASASDNRLSDDCLRGVADRNKCCAGVPDAWYAHLRNPQDCTKFYQCESGKPTLKDCALGTHWSVTADRCEWPHEAKCVEETTPSSTNAPSTTKAPEPTTTNAPSTTKAPEPTTTNAPSTTKAPEPTTTNAPSTTKAPEPTTTNAPSTTKAPEPTTTDAPSTTEAPTSTSAPPTSPPPQDDECAPEPVCHQCLNGVFPADLCCRDVQTYHKLNLADASDCGAYFQCVNGHSVRRQCPEGLQWSVNTDRCEWPQVAQCKAGK